LIRYIRITCTGTEQQIQEAAIYEK